jgi:hypothetical protein
MKRFIFGSIAFVMAAPAFADNPHNNVVIVEKIVEVPVPYPVERNVYITSDKHEHDAVKGAIASAAITWAIMRAVRKHHEHKREHRRLSQVK